MAVPRFRRILRESSVVRIQVSLWLLRVGIFVVSRADVLPVDDMMGKLREVAGEEATGIIGEVDLKAQCPKGIL